MSARPRSPVDAAAAAGSAAAGGRGRRPAGSAEVLPQALTQALREVPRERQTRQRSAIRQALAEAQRPLLPQEVLGAAQAQVPGLGLATVYRNLKGLVDDGEVCAVNLPGASPRFELTGHHHHHFQCRQCERVFDVHACPGDLSRLAPPGFSVEHHDLTLYGRCADCGVPSPSPQRRGARPKASPTTDGAGAETPTRARGSAAPGHRSC